MKRLVICYAIILLGACFAYADTPGWDPGPAIQGPVVYMGEEWVSGDITVFVAQEKVFWAGGVDLDHKNDPLDGDGLHCEWTYKHAGSSEEPILMGKTKGTSDCDCEGYQAEVLEFTWNEIGVFDVTCKLDDCHHLADDQDSKTFTFQVTVDYDPAKCIRFHYDANGNRDWMEDPHGMTTYEWDRLHRLKKVTEPDTSKWISYEYDWNNNRTKMTDHIESTSKDTTYAYNDRGLIWHLTDRNTGVTTYTYNDDGSLATMTYPNGVVATYTYDPYRGWLTHLIHESGATTIAGFTYEYNPTYWGKNGTRTSMVEYIRKPDGSYIDSTVSYTYDNLYRLTSEARTGDYAYSKAYTYDPNGNRLTMVDGSGTTYYHYDYASKLGDYGTVDTPGSLSNTNLTYDGAGNTEFIRPPASGPVTTYAWDWNNKLTRVEEDTTTVAQFAYDGYGKRISATFGSETTQFVYDHHRLVAELEGDGPLVAFYAIGPDGTISRLPASGGPMYYHGDGLWSVKATTTGAPASIANVYAYDAWGNQLTTMETMQQPCRYVGQLGYYAHYQDSGFQLLQLGSRYYEPRLGRFLSGDMIGYDDGYNLYAYSHNDPVNALDSSGLAAVKPYPGLPNLPGLGPDHPSFAPMPYCMLQEFCPEPNPVGDYYSCLAECGLGALPIPIDIRFPRTRPDKNWMINPDYWRKCKIVPLWRGTPGPKAWRVFRRVSFAYSYYKTGECVYECMKDLDDQW